MTRPVSECNTSKKCLKHFFDTLSDCFTAVRFFCYIREIIPSEVIDVLRTFLFGACAYPLIELAYRRRTHWAMALAGGLSVLMIDLIRRRRGNLIWKSLLSGSSITLLELLIGNIWNRDYSIWDYRSTPLNFQGQICFPFSLIWCCLSACAIMLLNHLSRKQKHPVNLQV